MASSSMVPGASVRSGLRWQHPFVDVFKIFGTDALAKGSALAADVRGDVVEEMDRTICRRVWRIRGSVSSNNFIQLPSSKADMKTLDLTGEYIYLQVKPLDMNFFTIHLDFIVSGGNRFRVTLSNLFTEVKTTYHSVQCPCHLPNRWTIVRLHAPSALFAGAQGQQHAFALKSLQLCSSLYVRNVFTSDRCYTSESAPRDMIGEFASASASSSSAARFYDWAWMDVPHAGTTAEAGPSHEVGACPAAADFGESRQSLGTRPEISQLSCPQWPDPLMGVSHLLGVSRKSRRIFRASHEVLEVPRRFALFARCCDDSEPVAAEESEADAGREMLEAKAADESTAGDSIRWGVLRRKGRPGADDSATSISQMHRRKLGVNHVVSVAAMGLTLIDPEETAMASASASPPRIFFGHTRPIELLEVSDDGRWVASVQGADLAAAPKEDQGPPMLRLWHTGPPAGLHCTSVLPFPTLSLIRAVAFDPPANYLAIAGQDLQGRQCLMVFDMSRALGGSVSLEAKQTSADWDIDCLRFSPFEQLHLVSCGRESIRFWRVKDGHLPGRSVVLSSLARQSHFTSLAFEFNRMGHSYFLGEALAEHLRVFVGTADGKVLKLSYKERKVQAVYQLHTEAITCLCANEGFVVTASADKYVRVWPLDFKSFYLHAIHESPVVGVDITADGMKVLCSTADGSVGVLDMQSHLYQDVLRSHKAQIADAAVSDNFRELATVSCDGTLKVWALPSMKQTYEFAISDDKPMAVAFHPGGRHLIAVGFQSGFLRIFDVDGPALLCERRHHVQPIVSLAFVATILGEGSPDEETSQPLLAQIISCDETGALAIFSEDRNFEAVRCPVGALCARAPSGCSTLVCAPPRLLQYSEPRCATLLDLSDLEPLRKLRVPPASTVCSLSFSLAGTFAILGATDSRLHVFQASDGSPVCSVSTLGSGPLSSAVLAEPSRSADDTGELPLLLLAATDDGLLRVSQLVPRRRGGGEDSTRKPPGAKAVTAYEAEQLAEPEFEQCFLGHALAPHRILYSQGHVVTVSSAEVICWELAAAAAAKLSQGPGFRAASWPLAASRVVAPETSAAKEEAAEEAAEALQAPLEDELENESQLEPTRVEGDPATAEVETETGGVEVGLATASSAAADVVVNEEVEQGISVAIEEQVVAAAVQEQQLAALKMKGFFGCSVNAGSQAFAWQASPFALCHIVGGDVCVEDLQESTLEVPGPVRLLGMPSTPKPGVLLALDLEPSGLPQLAVLSRTAAGEVWLSLQDLRLPASPGKCVLLPAAYGDSSEATPPLLRLLPRGAGAVTAVGARNAESSGRLDVWRFDGEAVHLWASACLPSAPIDLLLLSETGTEFALLSEEGLVLWRCSFDEGPDVRDVEELGMGLHPDSLQFQVAEAPAAWDAGLAGAFTCLCTARMPERGGVASDGRQLLIVGSVGGTLWVHGADDNFPVSQLQLSTSSSSGSRFQRNGSKSAGPELQPGHAEEDTENLLALACGRWPVLVCGIGSSLQTFDLAGLAAASDAAGGPSGVPSSSLGILNLDGPVKAICMDQQELCGMASTAANTLWYFHAEKGLLAPLRSFHASPSRGLSSNDTSSASRVLASCSDDGHIQLWSCDASATPTAVVAGGRNDGPCVAVCFPQPDLLACAFLGGSVLIFVVDTLVLAARLMPLLRPAASAAGEQLTAMEPLAATGRPAGALLVGTSLGRVLEVQLQPPGSAEPALVTQLHVLRGGSPVCGLGRQWECNFDGGFEASPGPEHVLACSASCELCVWKLSAGRPSQEGGRRGLAASSSSSTASRTRPKSAAPLSQGGGWRLLRSWAWPEQVKGSRPSANSNNLEMLSAPALVACFIPSRRRPEPQLVAVASARRSPELLLYSFVEDSVVQRISLLPSLLPVSCLQSLLLPSRQKLADAAEAGTVLLLASRDHFAALQIESDASQPCRWLKEPTCLPGADATRAKVECGRPAICLARVWHTEAAEGDAPRCHVLCKSDAAISFWELEC